MYICSFVRQSSSVLRPLVWNKGGIAWFRVPFRSTLPKKTAHSKSRFGQNTANQMSHHSDSRSNQPVWHGDSSANEIELDPQRQPSGRHANIDAYPDYSSLHPQIPYQQTTSPTIHTGRDSARTIRHMEQQRTRHLGSNQMSHNSDSSHSVGASKSDMAHSTPRVGQNSAPQMSQYSGSWSNQQVRPGDYSTNEIELDPQCQTSRDMPISKHIQIITLRLWVHKHISIHTAPSIHTGRNSARTIRDIRSRAPYISSTKFTQRRYQHIFDYNNGKRSFNQIHQFDNNMDNQPGSIQYSNMLAPIDRSGDDSGYHPIYPASQASASNPGQYGSFVNPNNYPLDISSHQSFHDAYHSQLPTPLDYQQEAPETSKKRRNDIWDDDFGW
jgi:hypothetical protein